MKEEQIQGLILSISSKLVEANVAFIKGDTKTAINELLKIHDLIIDAEGDPMEPGMRAF